MNLLAKSMNLLLGKTEQAMERPRTSPANLCRLARQELETSLRFGLAFMVRVDSINAACHYLEELGPLCLRHGHKADSRWEITNKLATDARDDVGWWRDCVTMALDKLDQLEDAVK